MGVRRKQQLPYLVAIPKLMQHATAIGTNMMTTRPRTWRPTLDCVLLAKPSGYAKLLPRQPSNQVVFYSNTHITNSRVREEISVKLHVVQEHDKPGIDASSHGSSSNDHARPASMRYSSMDLASSMTLRKRNTGSKLFKVPLTYSLMLLTSRLNGRRKKSMNTLASIPRFPAVSTGMMFR